MLQLGSLNRLRHSLSHRYNCCVSQRDNVVQSNPYRVRNSGIDEPECGF